MLAAGGWQLSHVGMVSVHYQGRDSTMMPPGWTAGTPLPRLQRVGCGLGPGRGERREERQDAPQLAGQGCCRESVIRIDAMVSQRTEQDEQNAPVIVPQQLEQVSQRSPHRIPYHDGRRGKWPMRRAKSGCKTRTAALRAGARRRGWPCNLRRPVILGIIVVEVRSNHVILCLGMGSARQSRLRASGQHWPARMASRSQGPPPPPPAVTCHASDSARSPCPCC